VAQWKLLTKMLQFRKPRGCPNYRRWECAGALFLMSCTPMSNGLSFSTWTPQRDTVLNSYPVDYPAFTIAAEDIAGDRSSHYNYSLVVASYRLMLSHRIPLSENSINKAVSYVLRAREIAGPRLLFGDGVRIINILHEYDSFDNLFAPAAVIRKEIGLGARARDIWTFQGPAEMDPALNAIANSKGPTTIYIYAHGMGQKIRLSDVESLDISDLATALKRRGHAWANVLADECDGVVTHLPAALQRIDSELPSYILSSTPRGGVTRGSRLLNAISGTGTGTGPYFVDPRKLEFEDLAKSQDFVLVWIPTQVQKKQLERAWPFPNMPMNVDDAESYPAGVWELANGRTSPLLRLQSALAAAGTI